MKTLIALGVALFASLASICGANAQSPQPCQWSYSFVSGVATATYCGNVTGNFVGTQPYFLTADTLHSGAGIVIATPFQKLETMIGFGTPNGPVSELILPGDGALEWADGNVTTVIDAAICLAGIPFAYGVKIGTGPGCNANGFIEADGGFNAQGTVYTGIQAAFDNCPSAPGAEGCMDLSVLGVGKFIPYYPLTWTPPTLTTGTCAGSSWVGNSNVGNFVTAGACVAGTVILSGMTHVPNGYACNAADLTTPADTLAQINATNTSATLSGTTGAGDTVSILCIGY